MNDALSSRAMMRFGDHDDTLRFRANFSRMDRGARIFGDLFDDDATMT